MDLSVRSGSTSMLNRTWLPSSFSVVTFIHSPLRRRPFRGCIFLDVRLGLAAKHSKAKRSPSKVGGLARSRSGRRDSNSRPSPWQGDALPLSHFRWSDFIGVGKGGLE